LAQVSHKYKKQIAEVVSLIYEQPIQASAIAFLERVAQLMKPNWQKISKMLLEAEDDILAYKIFPKVHHRSIHSVNPLERLNREIRRRTLVVGVFPNRTSVYRPVSRLLMDTNENWRGGRRYIAKERIDKLFHPELEEPSEQSLDLIDNLWELEAQNAI